MIPDPIVGRIVLGSWPTQLELPLLLAFTPKPRTVTLEVRRDGEEHIPVAGRSIRCNRYTLHPRIPFPQNLFGIRG